jgi:hypothetical protein
MTAVIVSGIQRRDSLNPATELEDIGAACRLFPNAGPE